MKSHNLPGGAPHLRFINPNGLYDPAPNGYSHVVAAALPSRLVYVAGQGGETATGQLDPDFSAQVRQALDNLVVALGAADAALADVAKLTILVVDHDEARLHALSNALRARWGARPTPACTLIPVARLALDGMQVEIEATALCRA
ncbi:RidA family protein [Bordetella genomosp. 13]|uniref:RidA family protein n=1 Tax=Bordetella genomosp. 13 TaxID=463040 RepID=UPI0011A3C77E|nr:RidA family protein [Bordetella genomosp. 13]